MTQQAHEEEKNRMITLLRKEYGDDVWFCSTKCGVCNAYTQYTDIETVVNYLLSNGAMMPPCNVGDTVWQIIPIQDHYSIREIMVESVYFNGRFNSYNIDFDFYADFDDDDLGKTVFMTREGAERALKECEKHE